MHVATEILMENQRRKRKITQLNCGDGMYVTGKRFNFNPQTKCHNDMVDALV